MTNYIATLSTPAQTQTVAFTAATRTAAKAMATKKLGNHPYSTILLEHDGGVVARKCSAIGWN